MKRLLLSAISIIGLTVLSFGQAPTFGAYTNTSMISGSNATISPAAAPSFTTNMVAYTNTNFTGVFSVNPFTGVVQITDAKQAGVYPVTVKAFGPGGTATQSFTLTVTNPDCSSGTFSTATSVTVGSDPNGAAVGDFNGDGKQDLAVTNNTSSNVSIRLGDGLGGFAVAADVAVGSNPFSVAVGDFNGDGKQDLAVTNNGANTVSIKIGDGIGGFTGSTLLTTGNGPTGIAVGDFNEDGRQDLATGNYSSNNISIHLGDGTGGFVAGASVPVGLQSMAVAIGDFNEDGHQDLASANRSSGDVSIRFGDGLGGFLGGGNFPMPTQPYHVALGDFNSDGHQDMVTANYGSSNASVRLGDGGGGFGPATTFGVGLNPLSVACGDFDGNGTQDLAVSNFTSNNVSILLGNGSGGFTASSTIATGAMARYVVVGDFNADGLHDLANANFASSYVSIIMGLGNEINVKGNNFTIVDGDVSPSGSDHTNFGSLLVCVGTVTRTFTIQNTGNTSLSVGAITISGTHAADYSVVALPSSSVAPGGSTTFDVRWDPSVSGMGSATINIANDDCDENPYNFAIQGNGYADVVNPSITCPAHITTTANFGLCSAVVTYTTPSISDNCGTPTLVQTAGLPSGSAFPVGVTVNTFVVTDGSGNSANCSFSVTVTDAQAPVLYTMNCSNSNAAATAYNDGWQTGDNDGTGFGAWTLTPSTTNLSLAGFVTGSSITNGSGVDSNGDQDINTGGRALGLYSNSGHAASAFRPLSSPLAVGSSIKLEFDNGAVDNGQIVSFVLLNSSGSNLAEMRYRGNQPGYEIVDNNGITPFGSVPFTDEGLIIEVTLIGTGQATIKLTRKVDGVTQTLPFVLLPGGGNQVIQRIRIQSNNVGVGTNKYLYVNNFQVCSPSLGCPSNISVSNNTGVCGATVVYNPVLASDNCATSLTVTQTAGLASGSFFPVGSTTNTFSATDGSGNTSTCSFTVSVADTTDPVAICRNLNLYLNSSGTANIVPAMLNNGSTDNCGIASMSVSPTSVSCANLGPNNVTLTVTDASGNSSVCTGVVTVLDSVRPVANCQNITVQLNASGTATVTGAMINNGSTDACGIASLSASPSTFTCANIGPNNVTLTVTDVNGRTSTCTSVVTIADTVRPVANCRNLTIMLSTSSSSASIIPAMVNNGSSDNCGIASMSVSPTSLGCANIGPNTVTLTVTDASGNSSVCTSTVTVMDTAHPIANCRNLSLYLNGSGTASVVPAMLNNGSTDNCGIASMSVSPNSFSCANIGPNNVTLTVTDPSGNSSFCTGVVTVLDSVRPVANCQNISVHLNSSGTANITGAMVNNGSTDACGIASLSVSPSSFTCANVGPNTVTLTVTDVNGRTSTCNSVVTVIDTVRPVANCQNITVQLNSSGNATVTGAMINNGSTDACGIASLSASPSAFSCANVGPNNVTLTVTDVNGRTSTCTSVVTIADTVRPVANCQNITVHLNAAGTANITGAMVNNGSTDACGIASLAVSPSSFSCANVGPNTVTLTVTDVNGRTSTCNSIVTVVDTVRPVMVCQNTTITLVGGTASIGVPAVNNGSSDACGIASMSVSPNTFDCTDLGANTVTLTVTDINGNTSTCTSVVTVLSNFTSTIAVNNNVSCNGGTNGQATVTTSGGTGPFTYAWSPSGGTGATSTGLGAGNYTCTVTDAGGCATSQTVSITQPTALVASAAAQTNILCNGNSTGAASVSVTGGTTAYSYNWTPGNPTGDGTASVTGLVAGTWTCTVTDANSCVTTQTFNITSPSALVTTSSAGSILCNGGTATVTVAGTGGTSPYTGTGTFTVTAGTYSYTVTDASGCTNTTSITVTQPTALTATATATAILCNGGNATVTVVGAGGTSPYAGTGTFTVTAGTYSYTVTDANGCSNTTSITVTQPTPLVPASSALSIACNGGTTTVTVSASGGTAPYTGTGTFTQSAGTFFYTVTDANGCSGTTSINISEPSVVVASASASPILCNGGTTIVIVSGSGGTPPFTGTGAFTVTAGTYSYTVTDANGCTNTASITVTQPTALTATATATSILCNGGNATVTVVGAGGTSPYTGTGTFTVTAGTYSYTVTDANGCTNTTSITVTEPTALTATATATAISCNGGNATVTVVGAGGTSPYTGEGTFTVTAGTYSYTVTDANGCTTTTSITITEPSAISTSVVSVNVGCNGDSTGSIDLTVTGGTAPYTFDWNSGTYTTEDLTGLGAGTYVGVLTDANGCTDGGTIVISEPAVLVATVTTTVDPDSCGALNGSIDITVSGGTIGYSYLWNTNATTEDLTGVGAGAYSCVVTDTNGCTTNVSGNVNDPNAPTVTLSIVNDSVCVDDGAFVLSGESPVGGTFSGPGVNAGTFDPATAGVGMHMISYTFTDINGCTGSTVDSIFVDVCTDAQSPVSGLVSQVSIYPNPNNGTFTLQLSSSTAADVMIYDAQGKLVYTQKVQPNVQNQMSVVESGMYMVTVITADGQRTSQRVMVTK